MRLFLTNYIDYILKIFRSVPNKGENVSSHANLDLQRKYVMELDKKKLLLSLLCVLFLPLRK